VKIAFRQGRKIFIRAQKFFSHYDEFYGKLRAHRGFYCDFPKINFISSTPCGRVGFTNSEAGYTEDQRPARPKANIEENEYFHGSE
jgi:hypothetical protein